MLNIKKLGLEYEDLDYGKSLAFLLMRVNDINDVKLGNGKTDTGTNIERCETSHDGLPHIGE